MSNHSICKNAELEQSMDSVRRTTLRNTAEIAILAAALLATGCASQPDFDETNNQNVTCPGNKALRCFKRTAEPEECSCVTTQDLERLLEF